MKLLSYIFVSAVAFLSVTAFSAPQTSEQQLLKKIDDHCGDTWCSSDYNFKFSRATFSAKDRSLTINLSMLLRDTAITVPAQDSTGLILGAQYPVKCILEKTDSAGKVLASGDAAFSALIEKLGSCINLVSQRLPRFL